MSAAKKLRWRRVSTRLPDPIHAKFRILLREDGRSEAEYLRHLISLAIRGVVPSSETELLRRLLALGVHPAK